MKYMIKSRNKILTLIILSFLTLNNCYSTNLPINTQSKNVEVTIVLTASSNFSMLVFYTDSASSKLKLAKKVDYTTSTQADTLIFNFNYSGFLDNLRFDFSQQPDVITSLKYIKLKSNNFLVEFSPLEIQSFFYGNDFIQPISCNKDYYTFKSVVSNDQIDPYMVFSQSFKKYFYDLQKLDKIGYLKMSLIAKELSYFTVSIISTRSSTSNSLLFYTKHYLDTVYVSIPIYGTERVFERLYLDLSFSKNETARVSLYNLELICNDIKVSLNGDEFLSNFDYNHHIIADDSKKNETIINFRKANQKDEAPSFRTGKRNFYSRIELIMRIILSPIIIGALWYFNKFFFKPIIK